MAGYVLVHGGNMSTETWNKLAPGNPIQTADGKLGGRVWDTVVSALKAHNHSVFAPTLKDEYSSSLAEHIEQICALITGNGLKNVVLAGHSYGGMVITGVASRMPERISHLVYVDAALPEPGQSLFDIISLSGRDPLSFPGLEAVPPYVEKLQFDAGRIKPLPKTYILCTKSEFACVTKIAKQKIASSAKDWVYIELPACHVPMATMPDELIRILLEAGEK